MIVVFVILLLHCHYRFVQLVNVADVLQVLRKKELVSPAVRLEAHADQDTVHIAAHNKIASVSTISKHAISEAKPTEANTCAQTEQALASSRSPQQNCQHNTAHDFTTEDVVEMAQHNLHANNVSTIDTADRLAVVMIFSYDCVLPLTELHFRRLSYLHCSLSHVYSHLAPSTPLDVLLFVQPDTLHRLPGWLKTDFPLLSVLPIAAASWRAPEHLGAHGSWKMGDLFPRDYFLQGRWRLAFQMHFARRMGYQYVLQMDDDTFVLGGADFGIVRRMREGGAKMAVRNKSFAEMREITQGLAEFTR